MGGSKSEKAKKECEDFLVSVHHELKDKFNNFDYDKERLNDFLKVCPHKNKKYSHLWKICLSIFKMCHGQSSVERGFRVNKELLATNLKQHLIIGQRLVYDAINYLDTKLYDFKISNDLFESCKLAYSRYVQVLGKQKEDQVVDNKSLKRKLIQEKVTEIKHKKMLVEEPIKAIDGDVENLCVQTRGR